MYVRKSDLNTDFSSDLNSKFVRECISELKCAHSSSKTPSVLRSGQVRSPLLAKMMTEMKVVELCPKGEGGTGTYPLPAAPALLKYQARGERPATPKPRRPAVRPHLTWPELGGILANSSWMWST